MAQLSFALANTHLCMCAVKKKHSAGQVMGRHL